MTVHFPPGLTFAFPDSVVGFALVLDSAGEADRCAAEIAVQCGDVDILIGGRLLLAFPAGSPDFRQFAKMLLRAEGFRVDLPRNDAARN